MTLGQRIRAVGSRMALRRRAGLIGLLTADAISDLGNKLSFVALPWFVLETTGSPTLMGVVAAAELLPFVLAGALGAPLVDRMGCRRVSIFTDVASAIVMVGVVFSERLGFGSLVALVAVFGMLRGIGNNSRAVLLAPQAEAAKADMTRVTSLYYGLSRVTTLVGAPLAGILISVWNVQTAIALDVLTFVVSAALVTELVRDPKKPADEDESATEPKEPYLVSLRKGVTHLRQDKLVSGLVAMLLVTNLCNQASAVVLVPLWVKEVFNSPAGLGLLGGAFAAGALLGSVIFTMLATKLPRYATLVIGYLIGGSPRFLVLGISDDLWVVLVVSFISGIALSSINPIIGAVFFERTPEHMRARVFGFSNAIAWVGMPVGGLLGGWFAESMGLEATAILAGILYFFATLTPVIGYRKWRALDDKRKLGVKAADQKQPSGADPASDDSQVPGDKAGPESGSDVVRPGIRRPDLPAPVTVPAVAAPMLTVTLGYAGGRWELAVQRGLDGPTETAELAPAEALYRLSLLDVPAAREAAEEIVAAERSAVEQRVTALRKELARAEAGLAQLRAATASTEELLSAVPVDRVETDARTDITTRG